MKYIEEELSKRKSKNEDKTENGLNNDKGSYCSPEEAALQAVPEHLRQSSAHRSEEMLSNQMLSGIPEVDLGIEYVRICYNIYFLVLFFKIFIFQFFNKLHIKEYFILKHKIYIF